MRILFVCIGNICRSPIAEGVMRSLVKQHQMDWEVASAGTASFHVGEAPHTYSQQICQQHGVNITRQRAQQLSLSLLEAHDKVYAMSLDVFEEIQNTYPTTLTAGKLELFLNALHPGKNESVPDPWYGVKADYATVYDLIAQTCACILKLPTDAKE